MSTTRVRTVMIAVIALFITQFGTAPTAKADPPAPGDKVLILDTTVFGGIESIEAQEATTLGYTVDLVTAEQWAAMTTADFHAYRAIILGDNRCGSDFTAAEANATTWAAAVNGNVIINGTDPVFHAAAGGETLTRRSVDFAVDQAGTTGLYVSLSCHFHGTDPGTPVPVLAGLGTFTVKGVGCFDNAHIVATHPAIASMTDATLSNWSCSVHEAFDAWPSSFLVLAIARDTGGEYTAPDGSVGTPYILARGKGLVAIGDLCNNPPEGAIVATKDKARIKGTEGADIILAKGDVEYVDGRGGNDTIYACGDNETLVGGDGDDKLIGGADGDRLVGGPGNDTLEGRANNDTLLGGDGNDQLDGGGATDLCDGQGGTADSVVGGCETAKRVP